MTEEMNGRSAFVNDGVDGTEWRLELAASTSSPGATAGVPCSGRIAASFPIDRVGKGLDGPGSFTTSTTIHG